MTPRTTLAVPEPVPERLICSVCGLDWRTHPERATLLDCIALLRARVYRPFPNVVPYPMTPFRPSPYWYTSTTLVAATLRIVPREEAS